jgi:hypothetical protein
MEVLRRSLKSMGRSLIFFVTYDVYVDGHKKLEDKIVDIEKDERDIKRKISFWRIVTFISLLIGLIILGMHLISYLPFNI